MLTVLLLSISLTLWTYLVKNLKSSLEAAKRPKQNLLLMIISSIVFGALLFLYGVLQCCQGTNTGSILEQLSWSGYSNSTERSSLCIVSLLGRSVLSQTPGREPGRLKLFHWKSTEMAPFFRRLRPNGVEGSIRSVLRKSSLQILVWFVTVKFSHWILITHRFYNSMSLGKVWKLRTLLHLADAVHCDTQQWWFTCHCDTRYV